MSLYRNENSMTISTRVMMPIAYRSGWYGSKSIPRDIWEEYAHPTLEEERIVKWVNVNDADLCKIFDRMNDTSEITSLVEQGLINENNRYIAKAKVHLLSYNLLMQKPAVKVCVSKASPRLSGLQKIRRPVSELICSYGQN